jgi:hypothetical protein
MKAPLVEMWIRRLVACRGSITGDVATTEATFDLVHVQCYGSTYRARIVSRRTELDGVIVEWTAYPKPVAVRLTDGEVDQMLRAIPRQGAA